MEMPCFLSSLPFLIPIHSKAWPPKNSSQRVLNDEFDPYVVSIESTTNTPASVEPLKPKPLYFTEQSDHALSPIQIYLGSTEDEPKKQHCYLKTGDHVYLVDAQNVKAIIVQEESLANDDQEDTDTSAATQQVQKYPPSLVIQFSACQFRIFRNRLVHCQDDKEALQAAGEILVKASLAPFSVPRHAMESPARTSTSSSISHQKESSSHTTSSTTDVLANDQDHTGDMDVEQLDKKRSATETGLVDLLQDDCAGEYIQERIERCHKNCKEFHDRLELISYGLEHIQDASTKAPTALLSRTADCWTKSYVSMAESDAIEQDTSAELANQDQIDEVVFNFFPDRKADHRTKALSSEEATQAINHLLNAQKELLKKRHSVLLLPIRG